jgi:acyl-coenzyme A thioesterase 13
MTDDTSPPGYELFQPASPHLDHLGSLWWRASPEASPTYGLRIRPQHLNNRGTAHGGVIATLADITCGYTFRHVHDVGEPAPLLTTTHLATTYLGSARPGDWLEATGIIVRLGRSLATSTAALTVDGHPVAHATALFHVTQPNVGAPEASTGGRRR